MGNTLSVSDDAIQGTPLYTFTHDALNRVYDETVRYIPGGDRVLRHRYDRYGNRAELTLQDATSLTNTCTYNKLNQLVSASLGGATIQLGNYANGDRHEIQMPNGVSETFTYFDNGSLQQMLFEGPGRALATFAYTYNNIRELLTQVDQYGTHHLTHDGLGRLTGLARPAGSGLPNELFAYDRVGNREDPANEIAYDSDDNNRITASPGLGYTWDADGSLQTTSDGATFTHDVRNRLTRYTKGALLVDYLYDSGGRRVSQEYGFDIHLVFVGPEPPARGI